MTPAADDQLAAVLDEIAEMERCEGFEGPKITGYISSVAAMQDLMIRGGGNFMPKVIEDATVGEIVRAAKAHRNPENRLEDWMIDIDDGGDGQFVVYIKDRLGHKLGVGQGPLTIAAASAYRDALKHSTESVKSS